MSSGIRILLVFSLLLFTLKGLVAQTCSCASAPVFDPAGFAGSVDSDIRWRFELTTRYHSIGTLVEGSTVIDDSADRSRTSGSLQLTVRYFMNRRLSFNLSSNYTYHHRKAGLSGSDGENTGGLGDSFLSFQYLPVLFSEKSMLEISAGGGIKPPTGISTVKSDGVVAAEDMQPGSGSLDFMGWVYLNVKISASGKYVVFGGLSGKFNGENSRDYKFGNTLVTVLGIRNNKKPVSFSVHGKYQWSGSDKRGGITVPNTGGHWIYFVPSADFKLSKKMGIKTELELPLYRNLNGVRQFTSTFQLSVSVYYNLIK